MTLTDADLLLEGGSRSCPPSETWRRLEPLLPIFGIARVADITGLDRIGIPVFTACRPNSKSLSVFQGKGLTRDAARVSAVMEAFETWCAERVLAPLRLGSIEDMRHSHALADISRLALGGPEIVDPATPFLWIEGVDLVAGTQKWLPFETVHANYSNPEPPHSGVLSATTNGLASGNTAEEAVLHGMMEVIERDATTLWKLATTAWGSETAVCPRSVIGAPRRLLDMFEAASIDVAIWDCRSDLGVPTFLCLIHDKTGETGADEIGCGTHPDPNIALIRALTEAAQARGTFIAGAREDILDADYTDTAIADRRAQAIRIFADLEPSLSFEDIHNVSTGSIGGDIDATIDLLAANGINEVLAIDLSAPTLPFAVQRIVIPGLEGALEGPSSAYMPGARAARLLDEQAGLK